ncbi:transcription factor ETV6-like [Watersipora subatra]|uniref:transcription factor ETV6-like n=1 Tax=Watersipora subatra TaxID=2589382 RepID=UPI00355B5DFF
MSVSSERSCCSPASSSSDNSLPVKLKRRWIQMSSIEEDVPCKQTAVDLSAQAKKSRLHSPQTNVVHMSCRSYTSQAQPCYTLPEDPRDWTKKDVQTWLKYITSTYNLDISQKKFDMNGKALCLMTIEMFVKRVPIGGKLLYRDFRLRLYPAVFFQGKRKPYHAELTPLENILALTTGKYFS